MGEVAERAIDDSGASSVDIIGYSAGGVVARLWVRDEGGDRLARRVLTSDHRTMGRQAALGAELAGDCPPACQQLVPESDLLRRLNADDETPDGPLGSPSGRHRIRSSRPQTAALEGAVNIRVQDVCQTSTAAHGDPPSDPVVLAALAPVLRRAAALAHRCSLLVGDVLGAEAGPGRRGEDEQVAELNDQPALHVSPQDRVRKRSTKASQ